MIEPPGGSSFGSISGAEDDRVSVVAKRYSLIEDGTPAGVRYDNTYHWLMQVRDRRTVQAKKFCDPRLSDDVFRAGQRRRFGSVYERRQQRR